MNRTDWVFGGVLTVLCFWIVAFIVYVTTHLQHASSPADNRLKAQENAVIWAKYMNLGDVGIVCDERSDRVGLSCNVSAASPDGSVQIYAVKCETTNSKNTCLLETCTETDH